MRLERSLEISDRGKDPNIFTIFTSVEVRIAQYGSNLCTVQEKKYKNDKALIVFKSLFLLLLLLHRSLLCNILFFFLRMIIL